MKTLLLVAVAALAVTSAANAGPSKFNLKCNGTKKTIVRMTETKAPAHRTLAIDLGKGLGWEPGQAFPFPIAVEEAMLILEPDTHTQDIHNVAWVSRLNGVWAEIHSDFKAGRVESIDGA